MFPLTHPNTNNHTITTIQPSITPTPTPQPIVNCYNPHLTTCTHHTLPQVNDGKQPCPAHPLVPHSSTQQHSSSFITQHPKQPPHSTPKCPATPSHTRPPKHQDLWTTPTKTPQTTITNSTIRDETHIEPKILMSLETYLCDPPKLAT